MKYIIKGLFACLLLVSAVSVQAQSAKPVEKDAYEKPYHPEADAAKDIEGLLIQAKAEQKNIIIQAGGNWCIWCLRFNNYIHQNESIKALVDANYLYYHLNYSSENKNEAVFQKLAPEGSKLGYPFFIVLNPQVEVLAIHDSGSLESGKGYDEAKVLTFFSQWKKK